MISQVHQTCTMATCLPIAEYDYRFAELKIISLVMCMSCDITLYWNNHCRSLPCCGGIRCTQWAIMLIPIQPQCAYMHVFILYCGWESQVMYSTHTNTAKCFLSYRLKALYTLGYMYTYKTSTVKNLLGYCIVVGWLIQCLYLLYEYNMHLQSCRDLLVDWLVWSLNRTKVTLPYNYYAWHRL